MKFSVKIWAKGKLVRHLGISCVLEPLGTSWNPQCNRGLDSFGLQLQNRVLHEVLRHESGVHTRGVHMLALVRAKKCAAVHPDSTLPEFMEEAKKAPGFTLCQESCGCIACGCFFLHSGMFVLPRLCCTSQPKHLPSVFVCLLGAKGQSLSETASAVPRNDPKPQIRPQSWCRSPVEQPEVDSGLNCNASNGLH